MAKSGKQQHQILARMWNSRHSHPLMLGMQNGTATLGGSLVVSYKRLLAVIAPLTIYLKGLKTYVHTNANA